MSTIKISQLPKTNSIASNTANIYVLLMDASISTTETTSLQTLASGLFANNVLQVGTNKKSFNNSVSQFTGTSNNYVQINVENLNNDFGTGDIVVTANSGSDSAYYVTMGYANKSYNNTNANNSLGTSLLPLDGYLYTQGLQGNPGGNLIIGSISSNTHVAMVVGGSNSANVVLYANTSGVDVTGNVRTTGVFIFADGTSQQTRAPQLNDVQSAWTTANTALLAFDTANLALITANTAANNAQQAYNQSNTALLAFNTANLALITANTAANNAQQAYNQSNTALLAFNTANLALTTANTASNNAQQAYNQANTALLAFNTANNATNTSLVAVNIRNGAANQVLYQTGSNLTSFVVAPSTNNTVLTYYANTGFIWAPAAPITGGNANYANVANIALITVNVQGGVANQIPYQTAANATTFIPAPTIANTSLFWTPTGGFAWSSAAAACTAVYLTSINANGVVNTFALNSPAGANSYYSQVFINGVYQMYSTNVYSLSSNTIIFTENPPQGSKIEVTSYAPITLYTGATGYAGTYSWVNRPNVANYPIGTQILVSDVPQGTGGGTVFTSDTNRWCKYEMTLLASNNIVAAVWTGNVQTSSAASFTLPGGLLGANGELVIKAKVNSNNSANNHVVQVRLANVELGRVSYASLSSATLEVRINNQNSQSSQIGNPSGLFVAGGSSANNSLTSAINTSTDQTVDIAFTLASVGDTLQLMQWSAYFISRT